jgi:hypothetical protein
LQGTSFLRVRAIKWWTLHSFAKAMARRKAVSETVWKKFPMSFPKESIEDLIARFGPKRAGRYAKLRPHAEFIGELRSNCASYDTIVAILREQHGIEVSDTTVRHFCRDVLQQSSGKRAGKKIFRKPISPRPASAKKVEPQIAEVEFVDEQPNQSL